MPIFQFDSQRKRPRIKNIENWPENWSCKSQKIARGTLNVIFIGIILSFRLAISLLSLKCISCRHFIATTEGCSVFECSDRLTTSCTAIWTISQDWLNLKRIFFVFNPMIDDLILTCHRWSIKVNIQVLTNDLKLDLWCFMRPKIGLRLNWEPMLYVFWLWIILNHSWSRSGRLCSWPNPRACKTSWWIVPAVLPPHPSSIPIICHVGGAPAFVRYVGLFQLSPARGARPTHDQQLPWL